MLSNYYPVSKPSTRAELITRRTYNRPLEDGSGKFETWEQTVDRVIGHQEWLWTRAKGEDLDDTQMDELEELRKIMLARVATPSGRTLWLGGTDIAKTREASQFNPLPKHTKFVTSKGVKSFYDFEDEDSVIVLTHKGNWKPAKVMAAGKRSSSEIILSRGRTKKHVEASDDHMWVLKDGTRKQTDQLSYGDQFHYAPEGDFYEWDYDTAQPDEQLWWCYGFVYGDGSIAKSGDSVTSRVRLCKSKGQFLSRFTGCGFGHSFPPSCEGDPFVYTGQYLKTLPTEMDDPRVIKAFLRGYLDADGSKKVQRGEVRFIGISCSDPEAADFVATYAPMFGLYILKENDVEVVTNYGLREATDFSFTTSSKALLWKVEEVTELSDPLDCWCLTVEDDHSFVLPNSIVSGNCAFKLTETVHDVVDGFWNLLQGCGQGFKPVPGILSGFSKKTEIKIVRSQKVIGDPKGREGTRKRTFMKGGKRHFHITVGDSAEAWAKLPGKLLALKGTYDVIVLDYSQVRAGGIRLKGYGWISSGDETISVAMKEICDILNKRAGQLLTHMDILDIMNWLGTTLSSRRSAEIALLDAENPEIEDFIVAKKDFWEWYDEGGDRVTPDDFLTHEEVMSGKGPIQDILIERMKASGAKQRHHRQQSNNSIVFWRKPDRAELDAIFDKIVAAGGSEPGFLNGQAAHRRAAWFKGVNPCAEILLGNKSFCNLVTPDWGKLAHMDRDAALNVLRLIARANYRQTCVDLRDGILQDTWHELNEFLRLCGVGAAGIVKMFDILKDEEKIIEWLKQAKSAARDGAFSMADELGTPRPKAVTTVKPDGTIGKMMDTTEGVHRPLGKYIFNNVTYSKHDEVLPLLAAAGYKVVEKPFESDSMLVTFPVAYEDVEFDLVDGKYVNMETAVEQLERYKLLMLHYVDHNCSITVSYDPSEVPAIVDWILENWDIYVGVSFIFRNDPTKTAKDLGFEYLPQEVVTEETYNEYVSRLRPVDLNGTSSLVDDLAADCSTGACPIR